jgi:hypothetical protein
VDKGTAPLAVPPEGPELVKAIPDIFYVILDPPVGKDTPKARGKTLDLVKNLVPTVKITWAEEVDEGGESGDDGASEDSSMWPFGHQSAPVASSNPPASFLSQPLLPRGHAERQASTGNGNGNGEGSGSGNLPSCQCPP